MMTRSTFTLLTVALATLTVSPQFCQAQGSDPNLQCLEKSPGEQCSVTVTYPDPLGTLTCNQLVLESQWSLLDGAPSLRVIGTTNAVSRALLVLFDPDAPSPGYVHWIAIVSIDSNGDVSVLQDVISYVKPYPPQKSGEHRYQSFIFLTDSTTPDPLVYDGGRRLALCAFKDSNQLGPPLASSQFRFARV